MPLQASPFAVVIATTRQPAKLVLDQFMRWLITCLLREVQCEDLNILSSATNDYNDDELMNDIIVVVHNKNDDGFSTQQLSMMFAVPPSSICTLKASCTTENYARLVVQAASASQ